MLPSTDAGILADMSKLADVVGIARRKTARIREGEQRHAGILAVYYSIMTSAGSPVPNENAAAMLKSAFKILRNEVARFAGYVDHEVTGGFLAVLCARPGEESPSRRTLDAALALRARQEEINRILASRRLKLVVGIGAHSGMVRLALRGRTHTRTQAPSDSFGAAIALGMRARPQRTLLSSVCRMEAGAAFRYDDAGTFTVNTAGKTLMAIPLLGAAAADGAGKQPALQTVFVGRDAELARLLEAWQRPQTGLIGIRAPSGMGKTALCRAFLNRIAARGAVEVLRGECRAGVAAPFSLFRGMVETYWDPEVLADPARLEQECRRLAEYLDAETAALFIEHRSLLPHIAGMTGKPAEFQSLDQTMFSLTVMVFLTWWIHSVARQAERHAAGPVVLLIGNAHGIDDSSLGVLRMLRSQTHAPRMLWLLDYRPEMRLERLELGAVEELELGPLTPDEAREMVTALLPGWTGSPRIMAKIQEFSAGSPYCIEQLIRYWIAAGVLEYREHWLLHAERVHVPPTLQQTIFTTIDSLNKYQKRTLLAAAALGRRFRRAALNRMLLHLGETLDPDETLPELTAQGYLTHRPEEWEDYEFCNQLTQQAAYESLVDENRRQMHRAAGEAYEGLLGEAFPQQAPLLFRHFLAAERVPQALVFLYGALSQLLQASDPQGVLELTRPLLAPADGSKSTAMPAVMRHWIHIARLIAHNRQSRPQDALREMEALAGITPAVGPYFFALFAHACVDLQTRDGRPDGSWVGSAAWWDQIVSVFDLAGNAALRPLIFEIQARHAKLAGDYPRSLELLNQALALPLPESERIGLQVEQVLVQEMDFRYDGFEDRIRHLLEICPSTDVGRRIDLHSYYYGFLDDMGRFDEGLRQITEALRLARASFLTERVLWLAPYYTEALLTTRRLDEARRFLQDMRTGDETRDAVRRSAHLWWPVLEYALQARDKTWLENLLRDLLPRHAQWPEASLETWMCGFLLSSALALLEQPEAAAALRSNTLQHFERYFTGLGLVNQMLVQRANFNNALHLQSPDAERLRPQVATLLKTALSHMETPALRENMRRTFLQDFPLKPVELPL